MPRLRHGLWASMTTLALAVSADLGAPETARADAATAQCTVTGSALMPVDLPIYDKSDGGGPIARFTGGHGALQASDFFSGGGTRVRVATGTGKGSFRLDGWIEASKLPLFTGQDVAVIPGHLWIAAQREVQATSLTSGKLRVRKYVGAPFNQTFTTSAACSALRFSASTPSGWSPSGDARGFVAKKDVELYDSGEGDRSLVTILTPAPESDGVLLWSTERRGDWVRIEHHSDVVIDAWAKASELKALPAGETMDQQVGPTTRRSPPQLGLSTQPKLIKTTKEHTLRASASAKGDVIGRIEADTETYVLDIVAGWASVLPKALNVMPYGEGHFWAKASDLGVAP